MLDEFEHGSQGRSGAMGRPLLLRANTQSSCVALPRCAVGNEPMAQRHRLVLKGRWSPAQRSAVSDAPASLTPLAQHLVQSPVAPQVGTPGLRSRGRNVPADELRRSPRCNLPSAITSARRKCRCHRRYGTSLKTPGPQRVLMSGTHSAKQLSGARKYFWAPASLHVQG